MHVAILHYPYGLKMICGKILTKFLDKFSAGFEDFIGNIVGLHANPISNEKQNKTKLDNGPT